MVFSRFQDFILVSCFYMLSFPGRHTQFSELNNFQRWFAITLEIDENFKLIIWFAFLTTHVILWDSHLFYSAERATWTRRVWMDSRHGTFCWPISSGGLSSSGSSSASNVTAKQFYLIQTCQIQHALQEAENWIPRGWWWALHCSWSWLEVIQRNFMCWWIIQSYFHKYVYVFMYACMYLCAMSWKCILGVADLSS